MCVYRIFVLMIVIINCTLCNVATANDDEHDNHGIIITGSSQPDIPQDDDKVCDVMGSPRSRVKTGSMVDVQELSDDDMGASSGPGDDEDHNAYWQVLVLAISKELLLVLPVCYGSTGFLLPG